MAEMKQSSTPTAIVTGASMGIGRQIAVDLACAGYSVVVVARGREQLERTKQVCLARAPKSTIVCCPVDVTSRGAAQKITDCALQSFGRITVLVNNVGVNIRQSLVGAMDDFPAAVAVLRKTMDVNVQSVMELTMAALPHLLRNALPGSRHDAASDVPGFKPLGGSAVIFVSSLLGKQVALIPGHSAYAAAKCAITGFASGLWAEVRCSGVLVSTVYPGLVATDMGADFKAEFGSLVDRKLTAEQFLQPSDVSHAVLTLVKQPRSSCISDIVLHPQRDLFRQALFANIPALNAVVSRPGPVPFVNAKVAFITGAGKGIGRAIALGFARDGYDAIAIVARSKNDLAAVTKECFAINPKCRVLSFPLDVADTEMLKAAVTSTVTQCGTLSAVISNAGVNRRRSAALCSDSGRVWEQVTAVNLLAGMHLTRFALPHLMRHAAKATRRADTLLCFVNTHYAQPTQQRLPGASIYVTTKTGLAGFAQAVMEDVRDMGVKVVTLFPGLVNTRLGRAKGPIERKYNNAAQQPEDMIQCSDLMYAIRYALACSETACPTEIVTQTLGHTMPLIRRECKRFLDENAPSWVALKSKL